MNTFLKYFLFAVAFGVLISCEALDDLGKDTYAWVDSDYYQMDFDVEPSKAGFKIFSEEFFAGNLDQVLVDAGLEADKIEEVVLSEAEVKFRETDVYDNFDLLRFIELTVYTDSAGEMKIAWSDPVPGNQNSLTLDITDTDVLRYLNEDEFVLTAQGYLKEGINEGMKLHARTRFRIKVRVN